MMSRKHDLMKMESAPPIPREDLRRMIEETGQGIAAADRAVIFEKFSRLGDSSRAGGAGLGLAICREIMTRLGGDVVYVATGKGACFRVILPGSPAVDARNLAEAAAR